MADTIVSKPNLSPVKVTNLFSSTPNLNSYEAYRVGNCFIVYMDVKGSIGSGWVTLATINSNKYTFKIGMDVTACNNTTVAQIHINGSGQIQRYYASNTSIGFLVSTVFFLEDK